MMRCRSLPEMPVRRAAESCPWLRALVRKGLTRAGRSVDDCEDIVQEALLAVHLKRHTWDHSQPLEPWVRAIAGYKLVEHLRRRCNTVHVFSNVRFVDISPSSQNNKRTILCKMCLTIGVLNKRVFL